MLELAQRIQRLEDIEAIRQLKALYFHACDRKDIATLRDCFCESDVKIDYGAIGAFDNRDDFIAVFKDKACHEHIIDMHHGQNVQIDWQSEQLAYGTVDLYFHQINMVDKVITQIGGFYKDRYVKTGSRWRIADTHFQVTSTFVSSFSAPNLGAVYVGAAPPAI